VLSAEEPRGEDQRGSFRIWADAFGLQVRFPDPAELGEWGASADHFPTAPPASPAGETIVLGTLDWNDDLPGWVGRWRLNWHGADHSWGVSGVNYDAAFRDILRGVAQVGSGKGSPD
jgi:hypothetical protein